MKPAKQPFPELVQSVLDEEGMARQRAFAMDIDDLHQLLQSFNRRGICFINVQGSLGERQRGRGESDDGGSDYDDEDLSPHDRLRPEPRSSAGSVGTVTSDMVGLPPSPIATLAARQG